MKLKLGIVAPRLPAQVGGGYTFVEEIVRAVGSQSRHEVTVFDCSRDFAPISPLSTGPQLGQRPSKVSRKLYKLIHLAATVSKNAGLRPPVPPAWEVRQLQANLQRYGVQAVYYPEPSAVFHTDLPFISTVWDLQHRLQPYFPEVSARGQWDSRESIYQCFLPRASLVITGTQRGKSEIEYFYRVDSHRIKVLPLPTPSFALERGFRTSGMQPSESLKKFGLSSKPFILYPAQFWPHKNHVVILETLRVLRQSNIELQAVFVGSDQGNESIVRSLVHQLGLSDQVTFLGFVSRDELCDLYQNCFALVFPSYFGPDNLPPLEAFAMGAPVIAADVPGTKEQLGDAALFFPPGDSDALAEQIVNLRQTASLRETLIAAGLERASRWTSQHYAAALDDAFDELVPFLRCWQLN